MFGDRGCDHVAAVAARADPARRYIRAFLSSFRWDNAANATVLPSAPDPSERRPLIALPIAAAGVLSPGVVGPRVPPASHTDEPQRGRLTDSHTGPPNASRSCRPHRRQRPTKGHNPQS